MHFERAPPQRVATLPNRFVRCLLVVCARLQATTTTTLNTTRITPQHSRDQSQIVRFHVKNIFTNPNLRFCLRSLCPFRSSASGHHEQMATAQTVYRIAARRFAPNRRRQIRSGRQIGAARHSRRCPAQAVVGATGNGDQSEKVRNGAEHQNGADETNARPPATGVGQSANASAAPASFGTDVSVSVEMNQISCFLQTTWQCVDHNR